MKKIYSIYFLLGLFITAFYSCGEDSDSRGTGYS